MPDHAAFLSIVFATVSIALGLIGLFRGAQMARGHRPDLLTDWEGRPIPGPQAAVAAAFGRVYLGCGVCLVLLPLLLLTGLHPYLFAALMAFGIWYWFYAIDCIALRNRANRQ